MLVFVYNQAKAHADGLVATGGEWTAASINDAVLMCINALVDEDHGVTVSENAGALNLPEELAKKVAVAAPGAPKSSTGSLPAQTNTQGKPAHLSPRNVFSFSFLRQVPLATAKPAHCDHGGAHSAGKAAKATTAAALCRGCWAQAFCRQGCFVHLDVHRLCVVLLQHIQPRCQNTLGPSCVGQRQHALSALRSRADYAWQRNDPRVPQHLCQCSLSKVPRRCDVCSQ